MVRGPGRLVVLIDRPVGQGPTRFKESDMKVETPEQ